MTLLYRDPLGCNDLTELQHWVALLQELLLNRRELDRCSREMTDLLFQVNHEQGDQIAWLKYRVSQLEEQVSQYESACSMSSAERQN